jgi:hypothetical protein
MADTKSLAYAKETKKNTDSLNTNSLITATVIANYGDPGLDEDYYFDVLSRYVICIIESSNRLITADGWANGKSLIVVKRPESLWINYQGGFTNDVATQQRIDYNLNTNVGPAANYSTNAIPRINYPYQMGETIQVRRLTETVSSLVQNNYQKFFYSQCTNSLMDARYKNYGIWHEQGMGTLSYYSSTQQAQIIEKTLAIIDGQPNYFNIRLNKYQYEAFMLTKYPESTKALAPFFLNKTTPNKIYETYQGGYIFFKDESVEINRALYEDVNAGPLAKQRLSVDSCIPLIVTTPNSFSVPSTRATATISYTPTYITKSN